jgi:hypothetical protein
MHALHRGWQGETLPKLRVEVGEIDRAYGVELEAPDVRFDMQSKNALVMDTDRWSWIRFALIEPGSSRSPTV